MDGVVAQQQAIGRVIGVGRQAADDVAGVDVLQIDGHAQLLEVGDDGLAQEKADVAQFDIAGSVGARLAADEVLPRALGHGNDGMAARRQPVAQGGQECRQRERLLRHEAEVDLAIGQRGVGGDEA